MFGNAVSASGAVGEYTICAFSVSDEDGNAEVTIAKAEKTYSAASSI